MSWANAYVGLPQRDMGRDRNGCDCWGLARIVYRAELGILLPVYSGGVVCAGEAAEIAELIAEAGAQAPWQAVSGPRAFDMLLFRRGAHARHLGVAIDARRMLHMDRHGACIVDHTAPLWSHRNIGAWRHDRSPS